MNTISKRSGNALKLANIYDRYLIFAGKPVAFDEVWIVGDTHFLAQARRGLDQLKEGQNFNSRSDRKRLIYILENFEVLISTFHFSWSITTQIRGGLANLLSSRWRLPNYIYIVFSNDQVEDSEILGDEIYKVLDQLYTAINRMITDRKLVLPKKARCFKPPQIIVVKTVPKALHILNKDNFKIKRHTLNRAVQKSAQNWKWRSINIDSILLDTRDNFDDTGEELSDKGFTLFWSFISEDLKAWELPPQSTRRGNGTLY